MSSSNRDKDGRDSNSDEEQPRRVGQSNKVKPRELKAIQKGYQQFQTQLDREKESKQNKSGEKPDQMEDREMKKMRMYEEMFLKKAQEEERKRRLKEKREIRKQQSVLSSATKDRKGDGIDVISEADQVSRNGDSSGSDGPPKRRGRGYRRGRGRGRRGRRGRGRGFSSRKQSSVPRRRVIKDDDDSGDESSSSGDEDDDGDSDDQEDSTDKKSNQADDKSDASMSEKKQKPPTRRGRKKNASIENESVEEGRSRRRVTKRRKVDDSDGDLDSMQAKSCDMSKSPRKRSGFASADEAQPAEADKNTNKLKKNATKLVDKAQNPESQLKQNKANNPTRMVQAAKTDLQAKPIPKIEAKSNSSEIRGSKRQQEKGRDKQQLITSKSKDAQILFGDQNNKTTTLGKRPRVLSGQNEKDLKELATDQDSKLPNSKPVPKSLKDPKLASTSQSGTKRVLVQPEEQKNNSATTKLKEVVKRPNVQPSTSFTQKTSQLGQSGSQTLQGSKVVKKVGLQTNVNQNKQQSRPNTDGQQQAKQPASTTNSQQVSGKPQQSTSGNQDSQKQSQDANKAQKPVSSLPSKILKSAGSNLQQQKPTGVTSTDQTTNNNNAIANKTASAANDQNGQGLQGNIPKTPFASSNAEKIPKKTLESKNSATNQTKSQVQATATSVSQQKVEDPIIAATKALMNRKAKSQNVAKEKKVNKPMAQGQGQAPQSSGFSQNMQGSQGQVIQSQSMGNMQQSQLNAMNKMSGQANMNFAKGIQLNNSAVTQTNPCGAFPIFQNNRLLPYNEFLAEMSKIYQQKQALSQNDGNGKSTSGANLNPQQQHFCLVQTKAKLANELQTMHEQYFQASAALQAYHNFDLFCQRLHKEFGL